MYIELLGYTVHCQIINIQPQHSFEYSYLGDSEFCTRYYVSIVQCLFLFIYKICLTKTEVLKMARNRF